VAGVALGVDEVPFKVTTLERGPKLAEQVGRLAKEGWPTFLLHGDTKHWDRLFDDFAEYQILFLDAAGALIAVGHTVPFVWDDTPQDLPVTMSELLERALRVHRDRSTPNTLSALAAIVAASHQRRGLSAEILRAMRALAEERGMHSLVAPVRPTLKSSYPLTSFERYVGWKRDDGSPFDPWLRVHYRLGAEFLKVAPATVTVTGTVAEWEEWTGMSFPESGEYVVPGTLQPITMDREVDVGRYEDPNVWMLHRLTATETAE
jgi:GNAT superfamily N-acetyltransferase